MFKSVLLDTSLLHVVLPSTRGMLHFLPFEHRFVKVRIVPGHTAAELLPFPNNNLDVVGNVLVHHEGVHVAVCVE